MDYKELQDILSTLEYTSYKLEETYVENEGEVTEETELMEGEITAMKTLLNTEGVDLLGRWLKGKEDRKKALKAEKDYLTRQMEAIDKTIEFIKSQMFKVMVATGQEKIKGDLGSTTGRRLPPSVSPNPGRRRRTDLHKMANFYITEKGWADSYIESQIALQSRSWTALQFRNEEQCFV